jgi:iron complex transport system ATP-binding protein
MEKKSTGLMITIKNLSYRYGNIKALTDISLQVSVGHIVGLIGPNGSGKSTLLGCLAGIKREFQGRIEIDGRNIFHYKTAETAKLIAVVFQDNYFPFEFTAYETVAMGRSPYLKTLQSETEADHGIIEDVMKQCDCWQLRNRLMTALSGGERQRIILARALAQQPKLLLMDEPTNHLDLKHQRLILDISREISQSKKVLVVAVLHDLNLASAFCDRIILLNNGMVMADGPSVNVITETKLKPVYQMDIDIFINPRNQRPQIQF